VKCEDREVSERIVQVKRLRGRADFAAHLASLHIADSLPLGDRSALGRPLTVHGRTLANRFAVLPMEGWDGTLNGRPTDLVRRRWARFGASGASLIWGGEAVAVRPDGRANPHQLCIGPESVSDLAELRELALASAPGDPPMIGLQLTHSGRWSRPESEFEPRIAFRHPWLDPRVGATDEHVLTDTELDDLVGDFVRAAITARDAGFDFVDVKHCHGYLLHELLAAFERTGRYGGSLANRLRFFDEVVAGVRRDAPELQVGVRLSVFDLAPHVAGDDGRGTPVAVEYPYAFGGDGTGSGIDLTEPHAVCDHFESVGVELVCVTAGSPYYCPHAQRPAYFPPSDGYLPPRDPLHEVARLFDVARDLAAAHERLHVVATGASYLQEWLPDVSSGLVERGVAMIGYGRGVLSYPELPVDVLSTRELARERLCRTFSDCTTAPRNGLVSGCYPLDDHYKQLPERRDLAAAKRAAEQARGGRRG
jgi:NADPH2 dehydrogenase